MNQKEYKCYLETKLRNLKRKQAKLSQYAAITDEYFSVGKEIEVTEDELKKLLKF